MVICQECICSIVFFGNVIWAHASAISQYCVHRFTACPRLWLRFDFIECFTTTFMHTHSWLNWVDEDDDKDEVGLKEKPEYTRYINNITSK